jgi:hypothetical protein
VKDRWDKINGDQFDDPDFRGLPAAHQPPRARRRACRRARHRRQPAHPQDREARLAAGAAQDRASTKSRPALRAGYDSLHVALEGKPSKYAGAIERSVYQVEKIEINDTLPEHSAPPAATNGAEAVSFAATGG